MIKPLLICALLTGCVVMHPVSPPFDSTHIRVEILPINQVNAKCALGPVNGCAITKSNSCVIYSINSNCVILHELKHCLGWRHPEGFTECD